MATLLMVRLGLRLGSCSFQTIALKCLVNTNCCSLEVMLIYLFTCIFSLVAWKLLFKIYIYYILLTFVS